MRTPFFIAVITFATSAVADLHNNAFCVTSRTNFEGAKKYEILPEATRCACERYKYRNTGNKQWDKCPDCTFDGLSCLSADWHIGGDEMTYYCEEKCGAQGAEAN
ncbi:uncharacterized protein CTRU02_207806 [Colletotrichum truncatum]|uniref:Uncharacterized protein n=1 Tax=Colletotrichum truncatum TaxID=5467 RepID=A0ACC3Z1W5_COLTU|nr:uncharacterized protein CTRU02_15150 [Colletotrichum truncatum]KAF6781367.1 hypothetical protein CTRU02_15150 [Colletotrichum truncatum]